MDTELYIICGWSRYKPTGGLGDYLGQSDSLEGALAFDLNRYAIIGAPSPELIVGGIWKLTFDGPVRIALWTYDSRRHTTHWVRLDPSLKN